MPKLKNFAFLILLIVTSLAHANTPIYAGTYLWPGQVVTSQNGKYSLTVQSDGNLVFYRNDGVVRFSSYQYGSYAVMQSDGNFVQYNANNQPLWATYTNGHPGANLLVQDDGNLVVYSNGVPVWNIGPDPDLGGGDPTAVGDVVGRDMTWPFLAPLGHIGLWTGGNVVEANTGGTNAVRYKSLETWRVGGASWGVARPKIPAHSIYYCFENYCQLFNGNNYYGPETARAATTRRAYQIYIIGADYTPGGYITYAEAARPGQPAIRGSYRCDTFVVDLFRNTAGWNLYKYVPPEWNQRIDALYNGVQLPAVIFNSLKN